MVERNLSFSEPFFEGQEVVLGDWWGSIQYKIITKELVETWNRGLLPLSFAQSPEIFQEWELERIRR